MHWQHTAPRSACPEEPRLRSVRNSVTLRMVRKGFGFAVYEVRDASDRLRAEFEPARYEGTPDEGLPARLAEILQVVQDAREVLADDRLRDEYLRGLGDAS